MPFKKKLFFVILFQFEAHIFKLYFWFIYAIVYLLVYLFVFFCSVFGLFICLCVFVCLIACLMILFKFYKRNVFTHLLTWDWYPMFQISYAVIKSTLLITTVFLIWNQSWYDFFIRDEQFKQGKKIYKFCNFRPTMHLYVFILYLFLHFMCYTKGI